MNGENSFNLPPELASLANNFIGALTSLQESMKSVNAKLDGFQLPAAKGKPVEEEEPDDISFDVAKLETMSRAELVNMLLGAVDKKVSHVAKQVTSRVEDVDRNLKNYSAVEDVKRVAAQCKDFWDWKDEIQTLASTHPTLGVEQLYQLARASDPKKAKTVDAKYTPPPDANPEGEKGKGGFGGFFPSGAVKTSTENKGKLTPKEAANAAWEEAMQSSEISEVLRSSE